MPSTNLSSTRGMTMRKFDQMYRDQMYRDQMYRDQMYRDEPRGARLRRGRRFRVYVCVASIVGSIIGVGLRAGVAEAAPSVWSVTPSPHSGGATNLDAVSCTSRTFCMAVGSLGDTGTLVETWNGNAWTVSPSPSPGGDPDELFGVSCVSPSSCKAVGYDDGGPGFKTLVESWNGTNWSIEPSRNRGGQDSVLQAV